jgi:CPA2 family monovalent cation:H+ antiporter-2
MTLFFSSIGMLGNPAWIALNWMLVIVLILGITVGKAVVVWAILRLFRQAHVNALAAGICLAQVGEFSFVLAEVARGQVIGEELFSLIVSATIITLFLTPYYVAMAPRFSSIVARTVLKETRPARQQAPDRIRDHVLIVGFGPAGQAVGEALQKNGIAASVVDLNRQLVELSKSMGLDGEIGDATHAEVLEHLQVASASTVAITIPDRASCRAVVMLVRSLAPQATVVVRARYDAHRLELEQVGAHVVVNEEEQVGYRIAAEVLAIRTPPK